MFDGFELRDVTVAPGIDLRVRAGGRGPAVVLLHGHPRTHTTWYAVAPRLRDAGFTVVCPDLRGYGHSAKPEPDPEHQVYCDRAMAGDVVSLMTQLGHDRFAVVGHDRGSYVAFRAALDHPERVASLAVLDGVPIVEALERTDAGFAEAWWHWFFFAASPHAERVVTADPLAWYRPDATAMGAENHADLVDALQDPATVMAMIEDYRAGLHVDRGHDEQARAQGRRVECRTLVGWSRHDDMGQLYGDPAAVWEPWCRLPVESAVIDSGHHMAEEAPEQLATLLVEHLRPTVPHGPMDTGAEFASDP
ncbi:alpha/beta fold hydrolase [Nocardioides campestrisoli]|uniref:alpha/beta fold hydrolase n=1 Tax=Nocardioides campestrisoli TaxID=2736757 RepID=UPI00163DA921|nr:alpha/beta hydrolase [Nocardioides campestrisoli]